MRDIARTLLRSVSTISEELKRNAVRGSYDPRKAHHKAYVARHDARYQGKKIETHIELRNFVESQLLADQSPVNIAGRIVRHEKHLPSVSKDSIYRYIKSSYGRVIEYYRRKRNKRRRGRRRTLCAKLHGRTFIDKRPAIINKRKRIGDAEADFIVSGKNGKGIILVVVDRRSRNPFIEQILAVTIVNVHGAFMKIKKRFPELKTITADNDILLQQHKQLERLLNVKIYFCHPYHSWEKGTVENINKHIRKDIPKGSDISRYSKKFIMRVEQKLQQRILKCLRFLTPLEVLECARKRKKR